MTHSRHGRRRGPRWWMWVFGPLLAFGAAAAILAVRADRQRDAALEAMTNDPGVSHVHGLGVNPSNSDVYAATHMGVFRIDADGAATRIANRYQDTMGFTVAGPDHFYASGHPDMREDLPPLLGLLESADGAKTWRSLSLKGKADFHALRFAHDRIYGFDSTGSRFMVSKDGKQWDTRSKTVLQDFAISPADPDMILATTPNGLDRSADGGRSWEQVPGPQQPVLIAWPAPDALWLADFVGTVSRSRDGGATWQTQGNAQGRPEAFAAVDNRLYLATRGFILLSRDEGRTWEPFYTEASG